MKNFLIFFLITAWCHTAFSQKMDAESLRSWNELRSLLKEKDPASHPGAFASFPVYKLKGGYFLSFMGKTNANPDWNYFESLGVLRGSIAGNIATCKIPIEKIQEIDLSRVYAYAEMPVRIFPDLERVRKDVRADSVQMGWGLPQAFNGDDVIIGVTDWGFDYTHPMFYDTLLQTNRILAAWDQYKISGEQPSGFSYGVEYNTVDELLSAGSDTSNIYSYSTHGTHVAGIAGGSGAGLPYRGMAPAAQFLFTTFLVDNASVIDAYHWMKNIAESENKRLVINQSWGLHWIGTLDGTSLLSQAIDALSEEGVVFVSSGGNNGDVNFHLSKTFDNDSLLSTIAFDSYANPNMWGQSISAWGEPGNTFNIGISLYNNVNWLLIEGPSYNTSTAESYIDSILVYNNDTVYYNLTVDAAHPQNGRPHVRLRVKNTTNTIKVVLNASAENGTVHFWNVVELINDVGNWGMSFLNVGVNGSVGDHFYGISEPACTGSAIAVAAYQASYLTTQGNPAGGQIANFSSYGPLMTGAIKPDIAAPGANVTSSISSFTDASYSPIENVEFNGQSYDFAKFSGTSMSAPCVSGIVALILDANPWLTSAQVKEILQQTARLDNYTGTITVPGDTRWGYGKANALHAVQLALATTGLGIEQHNHLSAGIWPNPGQNYFYHGFSQPGSSLIIEAIDSQGRSVTLQDNQGYVDCSALAGGLYTLRIQRGKEVIFRRWVAAR